MSFFWNARKAYIHSIAVFVACCLMAACRSSMPFPDERVTTPVRFLLTFDDGPSALAENNPTLSILEQLENNPVQTGIAAVFFVQTRAWNGGGTPLGQEIMQKEHSAGHVLGFHTSSPAGHVGHLKMSLPELQTSLTNGVDDIRQVTGQRPVWLRPPYFAYSDSTAQAYRDAGFRLILSDLSANDGYIHGTSFRKRPHFFNRLLELHHRLSPIRTLPSPLPIVVTFHDVNRFTAENMVEYLQILVEKSREAGFVMAEKPFYDSRQGVQDALNVWWEFNEALRLVCDKHTCPPIGTYLPNGRQGDLTKAGTATTLQ